MTSVSQSLTITGVDGFVGRHLAQLAKEAGLVVRGVSRATHVDRDLAHLIDEYYSVDLVESFPKAALSDTVVHLAGLAAVGPSFAEPQLYINSNSAMVTNLCEAMLADGAPRKVVGISTGAVYQPNRDGQPIKETDTTFPGSPYVVSKLLVELQYQYYATRGLSVVIARPFNHIGPGQGPGFILPDLWNRIRALSDGEPLRVGNLATTRDYLDVRDVARAYLALATTPAVGTYNICSGNDYSGIQILETVCAAAGCTVPAIEVDPNLIRPNDAAKIVGSALKLQADTGWKPQFVLSDSIRAFYKTELARFSDGNQR